MFHALALHPFPLLALLSVHLLFPFQIIVFLSGQALSFFCHLQLGSLFPATHIIAIWEGMNREAMTAVANLFNASPTMKGITVVQRPFFGGSVSDNNL